MIIKRKAEKSIVSVKFHCLLYFNRNIQKYFINIKQSNLFKELSNISKDEKPIEKICFLENVRLLLEARQNFNGFKSNLFPIENSISYPALDPPVKSYTSTHLIHLNKQDCEVGYQNSRHLYLN